MTTDTDKLEERISILEAQVRMLLVQTGSAQKGRGAIAAFAKMSPRMHGAMQCIILGMSNLEIGERFGVGETSAKQYVRAVATKLKVGSRAAIVSAVLTTFNEMSADEYEMLTGLSKNWASSGEPWPNE